MTRTDEDRAYDRERYKRRRAAQPGYWNKYAPTRGEVAKARRARDPELWVRRQMLASAKKRAKEVGLPFHLTLADTHIPPVCPVLGTEMVIGGDPRAAPTIDRIIPALGYVPDNVWVISHRANTIKSDMTPEIFKRLLSGALPQLMESLS